MIHLKKSQNSNPKTQPNTNFILKKEHKFLINWSIKTSNKKHDDLNNVNDNVNVNVNVNHNDSDSEE